jgi:multicomponent Na+:H+ antiporter subunit B|uniref:Sodium:proton antiporter n=1 Tax=Ignisphaera aggregans TaxID=334771 RepID=A0A7J2U128_9CREN
MRLSDIAIGVSMAMLALLLSYLIVYGGLGPIATLNLRPLAVSFLNYTYNPWKIVYSAMSPEAVTAIVWDFRGLDTYFETSVLFIAIVGLIALFRGANVVQGVSSKGLSIIVKTSTKLVAPLILVAGASLAFHGHLSPGGGFQGGSFMTVAMTLLAIAFSIEFFQQKKLTLNRLLAIRCIGLLAIVVVSVYLLVKAVLLGGYAYIFQNMPRINSQYSMPSWFLDRPLAGILFFFNLSESIAVIGGLTLGVVLLLLREEELKAIIGGGEHE